LLKDISGGHNVVKTVAIECGYKYRNSGPVSLRPIGETEFLVKIDSQNQGIEVAAGIVGFADLALGDAVAPVLEAHLEAGKSRLKGIRFSTDWDAGKEFYSHAVTSNRLADSTVQKGFAQLSKYNLSFDALLYFHQLNGLVDLAKNFPDTTIVVDHVGGILGTGRYAEKQEEVMLTWKRNITALSGCPNVVIKLGGLGMPQTGLAGQYMPVPPDSFRLAETFSPYFTWCIEKFSPKRCMFESNFPVDKQSYTYNTLWNAFKRMTTAYTVDERTDLFYGTAARVYRL
jgi:predicted TIM-barrel fold metal-dependent hydrolase